MPKRETVCRVLLIASVVVFIGIAFGASKPPARVPIFIANAVLVLLVIILGSKWQRVFSVILLAVILFLTEEEYSAGKNKRMRTIQGVGTSEIQK